MSIEKNKTIKRASFSELLRASEIINENIVDIGEGLYRYTNGMTDEKIAALAGISKCSVQNLRQVEMNKPMLRHGNNSGSRVSHRSKEERILRLEKNVDELKKIVAEHSIILKDLGE